MSNSDNEPQAPLDQQPVSDDEPATVAWFDLDKQFGFVALSNGSGDAFLHMSVLKAAGYVWVPRGTTLRVRTEDDRGRRRVTDVVEVDTSTARPGEKEAIPRKPKT
jgi:cold shock protein